ncbi:MAG: ABC transporter permease subunit [Planctomycetes bacterium]|nr:ABC transporter permease subunit [Planctomycetota bacterium]
MKNFLAMTRRELGVYFVSPMAYIILTALLILSGRIFVSNMADYASNQLPVDYRNTLQWLVIVVVLTSPLVTMRLIAEEKSKGTLEIILTAPITDAAFVLAKFAAAMVLLVYLLALTVGYILIISRYGPVDAGAVACGYLGLLLVGGVLYSIGLFISSLCSSQITAGVLTFSVAVLLIMANMLVAGLEEKHFLRPILMYVDLANNFGDFLKGVVDRTRLVYLASVIGFFLFLTTRVVESRRWR